MTERIAELEKQVADLENRAALLQQKNMEYEKEQAALSEVVRELYRVNKELISHMSQTFENMTTLDKNQNITRARCDNLRYELLDPLLDRDRYYFPVIRSSEETVAEIIRNKRSMARFGDGEFSIIAGIERHKFQAADERLAARLEEVLHSRHPNMLVAIADNYGALEEYTEFAANAIRFYMVGGQTRKQHLQLLEHDRIYYNAYVTRPYVMYADNRSDAPKKRFDAIKEIWRGRKVIIVEGAQTRVGVGNDLLESACEVKRILAPVTDAYRRYDDILKASLEYAQPDTLFLAALGPSAGVLAYDLTVAGYQALDIGHLDLEYEWFLAGRGERVAVPYKYNNELEGDDHAEELNDLEYERQILADCSV